MEDLPAIKARVAEHFAQTGRPTAICEQGSPASDHNEAEWWYRDFVQREGETVFVPSTWHHAVLNLNDTVAVTQNYWQANGTFCAIYI